jgi:hypothetical protein
MQLADFALQKSLAFRAGTIAAATPNRYAAEEPAE